MAMHISSRVASPVSTESVNHNCVANSGIAVAWGIALCHVVNNDAITPVREFCPVGRIEAAFDLYLVAWQHGHRGIESGTAALSHTD